MSIQYDIRHTTTYRYTQPVKFGLHRVMFRPRDSHDLRVLATDLQVSPEAHVRLIQDPHSNSVALVQPQAEAAELVIDCTFTIEQVPAAPEDLLQLDPSAEYLPFAYPVQDRLDLEPYLRPHHDDPDGTLIRWAQQFLSPPPEPAVASGEGEPPPAEPLVDPLADPLSNADGAPPVPAASVVAPPSPRVGHTRETLMRMNAHINQSLVYQARDEEGTQSPLETLARGSGSCRDYALLMMEAARRLGIATRFVSGYLYDALLDAGAQAPGESVVGAGATHAWLQCYLPGAGWVAFDPTNNLMGSGNLIRVGVARDPALAPPISGSWFGPGNAYAGMQVVVQVTRRNA